MMDPSNVDTVFIGGRLKKWRGKLVGVHVNRLLDEVEAARDRVLARIQSVPIPIDGLNSAPGYTPRLLGSCCSGGPHNIGRYEARPYPGNDRERAATVCRPPDRFSRVAWRRDVRRALSPPP
jgi:hypothetical protein